MKRFKNTVRRGLLAGAALLLLALAAPGYARAATHPRYAVFSGQILSVSKTTIMVKGIGNYGVRTFSYSKQLSGHMSKALNPRNAKHGYHNGQDVEIVYVEGSAVAAKIKAKA